MAHYAHTAIVVTSSTPEAGEEARVKARSLNLDASKFSLGANGFDSFFVAPSGSGSVEGRPHPRAADHARGVETFCQWLEGRPGLDWIAVTFGREHGRATVIGDCASAESSASAHWKRNR